MVVEVAKDRLEGCEGKGQEEEYEPKRVLVLRGCHFDPHPPLLPEPPIPPGEPLRFGVSQREWRQDGGGSTEKWAPGPPRPSAP